MNLFRHIEIDKALLHQPRVKFPVFQLLIDSGKYG